LDYRKLPGGADSKLIWELSRWGQLVRLAQAAYVLGDNRAARQCVRWLGDWVTHNPPYRGWNWTSALETGLRLVQFSWIDALLAQSRTSVSPVPGTADPALEALRSAILPAHVWFTWRHRSFGSSANNHLIGELTGLILATARWLALARWGTALQELQRRWEHEVLAQFAEDGGNKEQALHYHLFSWEFCWQACAALAAAGRTVSPAVDERLRRAAQFFVDVQVVSDPWDYGDSDDAYVSPMFADETTALKEWYEWLRAPTSSAALDYWWGTSRRAFNLEIADGKERRGRWLAHVASGQWVWRDERWTLRFDVSPLGYLATAAHGHLDALHLSIWYQGVALVIDPGTGAYHADKALRNWLSSRAAHNGPGPIGLDWPRRVGPFLWQEYPEPPYPEETGATNVRARVKLPHASLQRAVAVLPDGAGCEVQDGWAGGPIAEFSVFWQFAPGSAIKKVSDRRFTVTRSGVSVVVEVDANWAEVQWAEPTAEKRDASAGPADTDLAGTVSPAFRKTCRAPYLKLMARGDGKRRLFCTTFLASSTS
jgi:hypothetical protein